VRVWGMGLRGTGRGGGGGPAWLSGPRMWRCGAPLSRPPLSPAAHRGPPAARSATETVHTSRRGRCWRAPRPGGRGAPMPRSISGRRPPISGAAMAEATPFFIERMNTPLGVAILIADDRGALRLFRWEDAADSWRAEWRRLRGAAAASDAALVARHDPFGHVAALERYFAGEIAALDAIPVAFTGTPFQQKV